MEQKLNCYFYSTYTESVDIKGLKNKTFKSEIFQADGEVKVSAEKVAKNFTDTFKELNDQIILSPQH